MSHPEQSLPQGLESVTEMQAECSSNSNMSSTDAGTPQYSLQRQPGAINESYVGHSPGVVSRTFPVMASTDLRHELVCSICLSIYADPVTLRCGHNFCRECIGRVLDAQEGAGVYSCPECRAGCQERPVLIQNKTLCNIVGRFWSTWQDHEKTGILCTYCIHSPVPAAKSCLMCEAYLCDNHLRLHSKSPEHILSDPTTALGNRKCSVHKRVLEYYCSEDDACICVSCHLIGEHKGHQMESLNEASAKRKEKLRDVLQKLSTESAKAEKRVQSLLERRREDQEKAAGVGESVDALFRDIRIKLENMEKKVLNDIFRREKNALLEVSDLIRKLEMKNGNLSRKMRHIEELCNMSDPVTVLQEPEAGDLCDTEGRKRHYAEVHRRVYLDVDHILGALYKMSKIIKGLHKGVYIQEVTDIFLDVTTAGCNILVSDDGKSAWVDRHRYQSQVISTVGFTWGRHCWDVEIRETSNWRVGACYTTMEVKGRQSYIGENEESWCLRGYNNRYSVMHDGIAIRLPEHVPCEHVRIVVDYDAGQLSFYSVASSTRHLHTFNTTFIEPLHAALWMLKGIITISRVKSGKEIDK